MIDRKTRALKLLDEGLSKSRVAMIIGVSEDELREVLSGRYVFKPDQPPPPVVQPPQVIPEPVAAPPVAAEPRTLTTTALYLKRQGRTTRQIANELRLPHNRVCGFFNPKSKLYRQPLHAT